MKRIAQYKKLFQVESTIELADLKKTYRKLVKEWHPDKFQENDPLKAEAEQKSTEIIDAYHFLVSIAPETLEQNLPAYTEMITSSIVSDFQYKGLTLKVTFHNGDVYDRGLMLCSVVGFFFFSHRRNSMKLDANRFG